MNFPNEDSINEFLNSLVKKDLVKIILDECKHNHSLRIFLENESKKNLSENKIKNSANSDLQQSFVKDFIINTENSIITKQSSPNEKIALFMSLFRGRNDVFALRFENEKTKLSGYSPVCKNKWNKAKCDMKKYPCKVCPNKELEILSEKYIYNHLAGKDILCRDVVGLYPLLKDDSCNFLALDFDEENWKNDVFYVNEVCNQYKIPSSIEISRSGNGAHLWIFFLEPISAIQARKLGVLLLELSMNKNHSLNISSFDRMFPNQDYLPNGGYGNLIALPLQGQAVKNQKSVFVNNNFVPYEDQWSYLSSIKKLSKIEVEKIINDFSKVVTFTEDKLGKSKRNDILKFQNISTDFPKNIEIILSNQIILKKKDFSEQILSFLKKTAIIQNPEFYKNQKMRLPVYNIPHFINCSEEDDECLYLPRGNLEEILVFFKQNNCKVNIVDKRTCGTKIEIEFNKSLYSEQIEALAVILNSDVGILSAGTGFGKTVVSIALIAKRKVSTLIIVNSLALLEQWKKSIEEFTNVKVGTLHSGKNKLLGIVDVALIQSLIEKKSSKVKDIDQKYGMIIVDECHHISAFSYEKVIKSFDSKFVYGLTATPKRRDGLEKIIFMQCGKILYSTTAKQMNKNQKFSHYLIPRFTTFHSINDVKDKNINQYYFELVENQARNEMIVADVKSAIEVGKTPLILSDRISHLELLKEKVSNFAKNVFLVSGKGTIKQKKSLLDAISAVPASESMIILATGKYIGEGFDNPRLDALFLTMPFSWKGTLSQYCGRIHRNYEGKDEVVIFDYVDIGISVFDRMYQKRLKGYKQLEYKIKTSINKIENENIQIEESKEASLFLFDDSIEVFYHDIQNATKSIYISTNYLKKSAIAKFMQIFKEKLAEGIYIKIITKENQTSLQHFDFQKLLGFGISVYFTEKTLQNIIIIDEQILWYGSTTPIGFSEENDCILRINNAKIASSLENEVFFKKD